MSGGDPERPYIDKVQPLTHAAMIEAAKSSRAASKEAGLDVGLIELVNTRVSQINGCVTCLSVHVPAARDAGVDPLKIDLLPAWRDADLYTEVERVALELAEALTNPRELDLRAAIADASDVMSTQALAALEWAIVLINAFNRVSIASAHPPRRRR